jgi:hypothetical protein
MASAQQTSFDSFRQNYTDGDEWQKAFGRQDESQNLDEFCTLRIFCDEAVGLYFEEKKRLEDKKVEEKRAEDEWRRADEAGNYSRICKYERDHDDRYDDIR